MPKMVGHQKAVMNKQRMLQAFQMRQKVSNMTTDLANITITAKRDIPPSSSAEMSTMPVVRHSSEMNHSTSINSSGRVFQPNSQMNAHLSYSSRAQVRKTSPDKPLMVRRVRCEKTTSSSLPPFGDPSPGADRKSQQLSKRQVRMAHLGNRTAPKFMGMDAYENRVVN